jgi:ornithine decarboxylase
MKNRKISLLNGQAKRTLDRLAKQYGTPYFIIDRAKLRQNVRKFRKLLPRVHPFYAVKANPDTEILKVFKEEGCNFDVASKGEMDMLFKLGVAPQRMLFANTVKRLPTLKFAREKGINLMTFDSEYELDKIAKYAPKSRVMVRIKVSNVGSIVELSVKFGAEPSDAIPLLIKARRLGLVPAGVSFHVGSQCLKVENYIEALEVASIIMRDAQLKQLPLDMLDIGGGFPITHFKGEDDYFTRMAPTINKEINRLFEPTVKIIAEPGRALVGPAGTLVMGVIGKSIRANKHWYYLDDGLYGTLSGIVYDHCKYQYKVFRNGNTQLSTLAGPTCDGFDVISFTEELPELEVGDLLYVENIGAYSIATGTNFNNLPLPRVVAIN